MMSVMALHAPGDADGGGKGHAQDSVCERTALGATAAGARAGVAVGYAKRT